MLFSGRLHNWPIVTVAVATAAQKQSLFFFYLLCEMLKRAELP